MELEYEQTENCQLARELESQEIALKEDQEKFNRDDRELKRTESEIQCFQAEIEMMEVENPEIQRTIKEKEGYLCELIRNIKEIEEKSEVIKEQLKKSEAESLGFEESIISLKRNKEQIENEVAALWDCKRKRLEEMENTKLVKCGICNKLESGRMKNCIKCHSKAHAKCTTELKYTCYNCKENDN